MTFMDVVLKVPQMNKYILKTPSKLLNLTSSRINFTMKSNFIKNLE